MAFSFSFHGVIPQIGDLPQLSQERFTCIPVRWYAIYMVKMHGLLSSGIFSGEASRQALARDHEKSQV